MEDRAQGRVRVGLLADPGVPTELADALAPDLPTALAAHVDDATTWDVSTETREIRSTTRDWSHWSRSRRSSAPSRSGMS